jgi:hypothetical protein
LSFAILSVTLRMHVVRELENSSPRSARYGNIARSVRVDVRGESALERELTPAVLDSPHGYRTTPRASPHSLYNWNLKPSGSRTPRPSAEVGGDSPRGLDDRERDPRRGPRGSARGRSLDGLSLVSGRAEPRTRDSQSDRGNRAEVRLRSETLVRGHF